MSERRFALIPCAGTGSRAGGDLPKQYRMVAGRPMIWYALAAFAASESISATALVLAPDDMPLEARFGAATFAGLRFDTAFVGGESRHVSVLNGLRHLAQLGAADDDWVLVHDAARPGLTPVMIEALVRAVEGDGPDAAIGGILAVPVPDTLKRAAALTPTPLPRAGEGSASSSAPGVLPSPACGRGAGGEGSSSAPGVLPSPASGKGAGREGSPVARPADNIPDNTPRIVGTVEREGLWQAQTPQMFRVGVLRQALEEALASGAVVTDEASAIERLGLKPRLVNGSLRNFKVTYPEDFALAEVLLGGATGAASFGETSR
ncbi:2-C-methyl-D-erythritol 4-phosphate cytidylyltransferase [Cupriavidus gilardii J11]|uniref:2-C-methyl-D-erythritol 4-phosphate cytidylyltransferase n=1 Tax=Cupriavidus gilardii J11 TaxID=936133 RepID=A0A562B5G6_9BURK|nr:2-C-methyl-D-erythritol 4-phosphate cytidylyltransferase [Cupriavidus gilardii]TWG80465.1 2-C-methyl-D-erythritol 4-phosphate cytidylyltransferase [Cupriavidus gilardii J11]